MFVFHLTHFDTDDRYYFESNFSPVWVTKVLKSMLNFVM